MVVKFLAPLTLLLLLGCNSDRDRDGVFSAMIYLNRSDSIQIGYDLQYLKRLPYVASARFISKEEAKEYLSDGNDDWEHVNPLPDAYEVKIYRSEFSKKDIAPFEQLIKNKIPNCSDVAIPQLLLPR